MTFVPFTDEELAQRDIAAQNLDAARGLPGAESLDIAACCRKLDEWASMVQSYINAAQSMRRRREYRGYSKAQFNMLCLVTVLQKHLDVRYNLAFNEGPYDASDSRNLFIHGLLSGHGGTCVTMPVLYTAIGRRLGYPLKLVAAKDHVFCRWDEPRGEKFNIEATSLGFNMRPNSYYQKWPRPITKIELERGWYLQSLTPREELALFACERGQCLLEHFKTFEALKCYYCAHKLAPHQLTYEHHWAISIVIHRAVEELKKQAKANPGWFMFEMPPPREGWEKSFYPVALKELNRIFTNACARRMHVAREFHFSELVARA